MPSCRAVRPQSAFNHAGQAVGCSDTGSGQHAFLSTNDHHRPGTLGGSQSQANAINAAGQVVGWSYNTGGIEHAFLRTATMTDLGTLGGLYSVASGINTGGQVVGWADTASGYQHAFL